MGLFKTGLKAAVAVKTADVIHERVIARQQAQAAAQGHAQPTVPQAGQAAAISAAPTPVSPDMDEKLEQLERLGGLRASGVLTDAEFEVQKANILTA